MRIKLNKEIEFFFKKHFVSEKYLLKKRLLRSIKKIDEDEFLVLDKIVPKKLESVDVGVYRGIYSFQLGRLSKHVHAFEPNPLIFKYLNKNLCKIINNLTLYNYALSNFEGTSMLKIPRRSDSFHKNNYEEIYKLGCATIHNENYLSSQFDSFKVQTIKLDSFLNNKNIGFIKIDVEGHEKNVLLGAINIIKKLKPNLLVEIEKRHSNENVVDTINYINSFGYKSYFFDGKNLLNTSKLSDFKLKNNYIFLS